MLNDRHERIISIPDEIDRKIINLRKNDSRFERCSYSEIVRRVLAIGIEQTDGLEVVNAAQPPWKEAPSISRRYINDDAVGGLPTAPCWAAA